MKKAIIILLLFNLASCSVLSFKSTGQYPLQLGQKKGYGLVEEFIGEKVFYAWGIVPYEHVIFIDQLVGESDFSSVANIRVEEYQSFENFFWSIISLGIYIPKNYRVKVYGKK